MLRKLFKLVPTPVVTWLNQVRFRLPVMGRLINPLAALVVGSGVGVIERGEGRGLRINAKGCNPGFLLGTSEPLEQSLLASKLSRGAIFFDIGANAGFYCIIAARIVGEEGMVFAFEPTPSLCHRITENAQLNDITNIVVIPKAVGATDTTLEFGIFDGLSVENSIGSASKAPRSIMVECISLDSFVTKDNIPSLIMIDVEGAEIDVLKGGEETIRKYLPIIMVEVHWLGKQFTDYVDKHLVPLGYRVTTYDGQPLPSGCERYHCLIQCSN